MSDDVGPEIFSAIYDDSSPMRARVARLIELLRSGEPIPQGTRQLLADLFDPDAESRFKVELKERRGKGRPEDGAQKIFQSIRDWKIAEAMIVRIGAGEARKSVVASVCSDFGVSRIHAYAIMKRYENRIVSSSNNIE